MVFKFPITARPRITKIPHNSPVIVVRFLSTSRISEMHRLIWVSPISTLQASRCNNLHLTISATPFKNQLTASGCFQLIGKNAGFHGAL